MVEQLIAVFCEIDDFCKEYEKNQITGEAPAIPRTSMALSEIMTITVMYHLSHYKEFKLFGDKGYMSPKLFAKLWDRDIQLVTKIRKNMKNKLMNLTDKLLLRKRAIIECVNDFLKNVCDIEHSRHRSVINFFVNALSALVAYSFLPKKPSISLPNFPIAV